MITEQNVSFETAVLLQSKGFKEEQSRYYRVEDETIIGSRWIVEREGLKKSKDFDERYIQCPTQSLVMRWLRDMHNIQVQPYALSLGWYFEIFNLNERDITGCANYYCVGIPTKKDCFDTYEQACEAAIKYCLENLI